MEKEFKIRASKASILLARIGLTEIQSAKMTELQVRKEDAKTGKQKPLTANMEAELADLEKKHNNPELPQSIKTYLHEWYANDVEDRFKGKEAEKGFYVENETIDFMAQKLGFGVAEKNEVEASDEYFRGTCDANLPSCIGEVKSPWNRKNLQDRALNGMDYEHRIQLIVYCHLYKKPKGVLFYGLMDTPADVNYGEEVIYSDMPEDERWVAYWVNASDEVIEALRKRVEMCRAYLKLYDAEMKSKLGKINDETAA